MRNKKNIEQFVIEVLENYKAIEGIESEDNLGSIGFDSLDCAEISMKLEEALEIPNPYNDGWLHTTDSPQSAALKIFEMLN